MNCRPRRIDVYISSMCNVSLLLQLINEGSNQSSQEARCIHSSYLIHQTHYRDRYSEREYILGKTASRTNLSSSAPSPPLHHSRMISTLSLRQKQLKTSPQSWGQCNCRRPHSMIHILRFGFLEC